MNTLASNPAILIAVGIFVGVYSGIMGLGGGTVLVPILILLLGFTQKQALGTSLAVMLPPVTLPAVIEYYRHGHVKLATALWIALGIAMGAFIGAYVANKLSQETLRLTFGFVLIFVAAYTVLGKDHLVRSLLLSALLVILGLAIFLIARWYDGNL
ncbi:MAG: sulfite exporter TauE/SafE family protein [Bacillota bacterium]